jgi:hypothetical protein
MNWKVGPRSAFGVVAYLAGRVSLDGLRSVTSLTISLGKCLPFWMSSAIEISIASFRALFCRPAKKTISFHSIIITGKKVGAERLWSRLFPVTPPAVQPSRSIMNFVSSTAVSSPCSEPPSN